MARLEVRTPNDEQRLAIEHHGGILLSAGAGSGKTYVLIEHVIFLLEDFFKKEQNCKLIDFELKRELGSFLSSIVMMTFTNKAAQEMQIRLDKRLQEKLSQSPQSRHQWQMVIEQLPRLNMGTIHAFCMKLIRQGLIEGADSRANIMSQFAANTLVREACHEWLKHKHIDEMSHQVFDTLFIRFDKIIDSFCSIFSDPELRLSWESSDGTNSFDNFNLTISQLFNQYGLLKIPDAQKALQPYRGTTASKWFSTIDEFYTKLQGVKLGTIEGILALQELFSQLDRLTTPSTAKNDEQLLKLFEYFKELKSFVKDFAEEIIYFQQNQDVLVKLWFPVIEELYMTIARAWNKKDGLTFSDLEYNVYLALNNREVQKQISKTYKYLIVDEFQDTSEIQFKILQQIIDNDFSRIFCVGDPKQAIYGFRGGELSVFLGCRHKVPRNLSLLANYRSQENIINFNNEFFDYLFRLGPDFEGLDQYAVPVEYQNYPHTKVLNFRGNITQISNSILIQEGDDAPSRDEINQIEASLIHQYIKDQIEQNQNQEICVLYSKLAPSKYLIDRLIRSNLGFVAQIKIPYADDPTLGILQLLLHLVNSNVANTATTRHSVLTLLESYIILLEIPIQNLPLSTALDRFLNNYTLLGPMDSFYLFLSDINLKVADFRIVASLLEEIVKFSSDDSDLISFILNEERESSYSTEFRFPGRVGNIKIMTTHAAKGLEFDHVILAGIHGNAKGKIDTPTIGKWPYSFRWKIGNKVMRTPAMILEARVAHEKDFAESKRLFYVAGTRAKDCLTWTNVTVVNPNKKISGKYGKNWIDGLRKIQDQHVGSATSPFREMKPISILPSDQSEILNPRDRRIKLTRPLFHIDSSNVFSGIVGASDISPSLTQVAISSELSVTRASMLADCPMKFYLANIIKFTEEDIEYLNSLTAESGIIASDDRAQDCHELSSSAERGSHLHAILSQVIQSDLSNDVLTKHKIKPRDLESINWVVSLLERHRQNGDEFCSEQPVKFKFAGHMITGTPDLVIISKRPVPDLQIWDFKTGAGKVEKEEGYWAQLSMYAHYYFHKNPEAKITLKLVYLDQQMIKAEEVTSESCTQKLERIWSLKNDYLVCNHRHCLHCNFGNICPRNAFSATYL
ncbi:MAG: UvrD-helicase domain-containing protein [Bdellovibrio sp.]|nr:UvrD-helicase domain-containing protein [Bdellovibrio sp.]